MTPEQWQLVKPLLAEALSLAGEARAVFLAKITTEAPALAAEVESLLAAGDTADGGFMSSPAPAITGFGDSAERFVGRRLGPYELVARIGAGGMGEVYRASRVDEEYHQQVAIKLVRTGYESSFIAQRLRAERQILASLSHPNIARLLDGGTTEEGIPYLVMELIDGQPITQYCDEQRLDVNARLRLFAEVCSAVQYAHQHMVIHRDLKPSNILVTRDGVPKLLDFGIAKIIDPGATGTPLNLTVTSFGILTPQYASPEQFTGGAVTAMSDVFSLGVVLYELLTGSLPYFFAEPANTSDVLRTVLTSEPRKPSALVMPERSSRRLRGDIDNIVLMALRKEPERRYIGAEQLADDIRRHLQHVPVIARRDTLGYRTSTFIQRHTLGVVAAGAMLTFLVVGIIVTTQEAHVAEVQRVRAERRLSDLRKVANAMIFEIHDSIRDLPGSSKPRHLLIDTSLHYLDSLSQEAPGDLGLQRELAAAYDRLGDLQGRVFEANESDYPGAQRSYRSSLALLQAALQLNPANADLRREMVVACGKLGDLAWNLGDTAQALEYSRLTVVNSQILAQAHREEPKLQALSATAQLDYGFKVYHIQGDVEQALRYMRPAVEQLARLSASSPENVRMARTLALGYGRLAEALSSDGQRVEEAWPLLLQQQQLLDRLVSSAPDSSDLAHLHAFSRHDAAGALVQMGHFQEAEKSAQQALAEFRSLSASDAKVAEYRMDIALALNDMAKISLGRDEPEAALPSLREALERTADPAVGKSAQARIVRADSQSLLGDVDVALANRKRTEAQKSRDREDACHQYEDALAVYRAESRRFATAATKAQQAESKLAACREDEKSRG